MQVVHLNLAAKSVLARDDGLSLNEQRQFKGHATTVENQLQLVSSWLETVRKSMLSAQAQIIQGATVTRANKHEPSGRSHKPSVEKSYDLQCVPLPKTETWFAQLQDARFVVFITDPNAVQLPKAERLHELYGMTPTQAKVTCEFACGASYKKVAQKMRISENTVRSHIKEIYRKTRVNRQADLVHLILSISRSGV